MPTENNQTIDHNAKNFLTESEMKKFLETSRKGRHGVREYWLMLMAYRHGLGVSELIETVKFFSTKNCLSSSFV